MTSGNGIGTSLTIDQHIHSKRCMAHFARADGLLGLLKAGDEDPSAPVSVDDTLLGTTQIWGEHPEYVGLLAATESNFVAEVASCTERGTVGSHDAITAYLSLWEIRARLNEDPPAGRIGYRDAIREHESTLEILKEIKWGVLRAAGPSKFICPDRPNGMAYIPIGRELTLVGNHADGTASEITVRLWNKEARENSRQFVFGHPDDVESFSRNVSM